MLYSQESGSIRSPINAEAFPLVGERERANLVVQLARFFYIQCRTRTFIFSLIGLYISDAASNTSKVPKCSADQHGQGVNVSHDYHVMQLHSK